MADTNEIVKVTLTIKQETFDSYVKENIDDLEMDADEAVQDAIDTCKLQGGNLYFVIKKNVESDGRHRVVNLLDAFLASPTQESLEELIEECTDFESRHYVAEYHKAHQKVMDNIKNSSGKERTVLIKGLCTLIRGQPDRFDHTMMFELRVMLEEWGKSENLSGTWEYIAALAKLVERVSTKHENNRCAMMTEGVQAQLCKIFNPDHDITDQFEKAVMNAVGAFLAQLVDDDQRSQGSQAHQRAKNFVIDHNLLENTIRVTEKILLVKKPTCANRLLELISTLLVSNDFCGEASALGCGELALNLIRESPEEAARVKACLYLVKALIGNDDVQHKMITKLKVHEDVIEALRRHFSVPDVALAALRSVTALTLRNPDCAREIVKIDGADAIINSLNAHSSSKVITRAGLMAIRNCVVRATELRKNFLELHAEGVANKGLIDHNLDEAKACLRDLGCEVALKEIWTGSGKQLSRGSTDRLKALDIT